MSKSNICAACKHPIAGQFANVGNQSYHAHCFKCAKCQGDLTTGYYNHNNQLHCEACYQATLMKCNGCKLPIEKGKCVIAAGKEYHKQCLMCRDCNKAITGKEIYPVAGYIYCVNCHFARKIEYEANQPPTQQSNQQK